MWRQARWRVMEVADGPSKAETVEVKKRRLRVALRQARQDAKLTQQAAADQLVWSTSKIVRIEQGTVPVTPTDVRAMLHLYRVSDEPRIVELVELAKDAREDKGWSTFSDVLPPAGIELFGYESAAKVIYKYEPAVIPGLFQTQDYARALLKALGNSEEQVERRLEVRVQRQRLLDRLDRPELNFILGEAAIRRPAGGEDVMREQIAHVLDLAKTEGISVQLLPFSAGAHRGMGSAFTVMQFDDPFLADLLFLENAERESVSRDELGEIKRYLDLFVELQSMAAKSGSFEDQVRRILHEHYGEVNSTT
jgi:transcriptional regulator with XRE-family HTH domain